MDCSTPGSSVLQYLPEFAQIHVIESVMLPNHLILPRSPTSPPPSSEYMEEDLGSHTEPSVSQLYYLPAMWGELINLLKPWLSHYQKEDYNMQLTKLV